MKLTLDVLIWSYRFDVNTSNAAQILELSESNSNGVYVDMDLHQNDRIQGLGEP